MEENNIILDDKKIMNYKIIKKICRENNLYETDELNNVLYLHMKGFHNIDGLSTFKNLKCLYINNNCIKKIQNLDGLTNLKALYLQNNDISTIENIECSSLIILNLSNNKIKTIKNLKHLKLLQTLNISNNLIENIIDLEEVSELQNLSHLDISGNNISFSSKYEISSISDCEKFIDSYVEKQSTSEIKKENTMKSIGNGNKEIDFFSFYKNFDEELNINENSDSIKYHQKIEEMDSVTKKKFSFLCEFIILIKKIKKLRTLFIKNNPFTNEIKYVSKYLIANIPRLVFLDDKKIKKEDICLAQIFLKKGLKEENELKKIFEKKKIEKYKNLREKFHTFLLKKSEKV
ncbi:leucine-rich repeat protein, putative [Plasmodium gallinaceum]|uniref:Leucine-rich repeat protein, putative n=1 Tax=Plasmodium gallinaceum TaxID=5849 RepID=A0A1J1GZ51_PLAGA|nr:leucine-rich repeat protein, putative [Plasmodium gallinaceum]CRG97868.1 leucine-rich repeat protein, putative [Plasmodium gallinaceum]